MRPLAGGKSSFWGIVKNLHHAVDYFPISIRINADMENILHAEELLQILADEGLSGKLTVYAGQIVGIKDGAGAPASTYGTPCFTNAGYARAERDFTELAMRYGFARPTLPRPTGAPCTAVRANELVVGKRGRALQVLDSVGNRMDVVGDIRDYKNTNSRMQKWLKYDPFADSECRECIALPVVWVAAPTTAWTCSSTRIAAAPSGIPTRNKSSVSPKSQSAQVAQSSNPSVSWRGRWRPAEDFSPEGNAMQDNAGDGGARRWLLGPPGGRNSFELASGDQAEVTPEVREAIEGLLRALGAGDEGAEVAGYTCFGLVVGCDTNKYICMPRGKCDFEGQRPCFTDYHCTIAQLS